MEQGRQENGILTPLKFMGFYNDETPPSEILNSFSKEKLERAFANVVRSHYQDRSKDKGDFIMNFGQYFRDCPQTLDFDFMTEPNFYFLRRVKNPCTVAMSAVIHNEVLIHKARKSPTEQHFQEIERFGDVLALIQIHGSSGQDGLKFPPLFAKSFKNSLTYAKTFPLSFSHTGDNHREANQPSTLIEEPPVKNFVKKAAEDTAKKKAAEEAAADAAAKRAARAAAAKEAAEAAAAKKAAEEAAAKAAAAKEAAEEAALSFSHTEDNHREANQPSTLIEEPPVKNFVSTMEAPRIQTTGESASLVPKKSFNWNVVPAFRDERSFFPSNDKVKKGENGNTVINWNAIPGVTKQIGMTPLANSGDVATNISTSEHPEPPTDELTKNIDDVGEENEDLRRKSLDVDDLGDADEFESNSSLGDVEGLENVNAGTVTTLLTEHVPMISSASSTSAAVLGTKLPYDSEKPTTVPVIATVDLTEEVSKSDSDDDEKLLNIVHTVENSESSKSTLNLSSSTDDVSMLHVPTTTANSKLMEPCNNKSSSTSDATLAASAENANTMSSEKSRKRIPYTKLLNRSSKEVLDLIDELGLPPVWTDSRASLIAYLAENDKVELGNQTLQNIKQIAKNSPKSFSVVETCFNRWENQELYEKNKNDYGTKKVTFSDVNPEDFLDTRNFKRTQNCRSQKVNCTVAIYQCEGSNVCSNEECLFKKTYANDDLIAEKRNTSQFLNIKNEKHCKYCRTDGYDTTTIEYINCNARAYWQKGDHLNHIYMVNDHKCSKKYRLNTPSSFAEDFKRKEGYVSAVKHNLRNQLQDDEITDVECLYQNASEMSVGSGKGPQAKIKAFGRPSPVKLRVNEIVCRLRKLDPNFILCNDEDCIITSSTRSLRKALQFDRVYGHFTEPGFMDVCFSRTRGTERVACSFYFYDTIGCSVIKVANGYIPSENTASVSKVIRIINEKIGELIQVQDFRLKPRQMFVDFSIVNSAAFLAAGYTQEEINEMLEGCGKHFGDMVEEVKVPFKKTEKTIIETYIYDWKDNIILAKSEHFFDTIRTFILKSIKDKEVADALLFKLKWWKDRQRCWSKAYSGLRHVDSNLSEVGHSHCLKFSSDDDAIIDDVVTNLHDNGRLVAIGNGSELAVGSGPDYAQIQKLLGVDMDSRLKQIEEEWQNPTGSVNSENCGGYQSDEFEPSTGQTKRKSKSRTKSAKKQCVRTQFSQLFKAAHTRSKKLNVSVRQVVTDTDVKKEMRVMVSSGFGMYSKGETFNMSFESVPSCGCSQCCKSSRPEVCAPQIWFRQKLLGMDDSSRHLVQVQYPTETVKIILRDWIPPVIDNEMDLERLFKEKEGRYPPSKMKYFLERTSVHTTRRRCFSGCHPLHGKEINTPPGNLNICVEGGLKVPVGLAEAVPGPIYLCASKKCAYEDLPKRTNITPSRAPPTIQIRDPLKNITPDEILRLGTHEEFVFNM